MRSCKEPECSKPRGGRNPLCRMHLKRRARTARAIRRFQMALDLGVNGVPPGIDDPPR